MNKTYIVIPHPTTLNSAMPSMVGSLVERAVGPARTLRELLGIRRSNLSRIAESLMNSARAIGMAGSAAVSSTAAATGAKGDAIRTLEGVGALIVPARMVDRESLASSLRATVYENVLIPMVKGKKSAAKKAVKKASSKAASKKAAAAGGDFWHLSKINVAAARAKGLTGRGVVAGILDTGIDGQHAEFRNKRLHYKAFDYNGDEFTSPVRDFGDHGTHVSALVGGKTAGVAPDVDLAVAAVLTYPDEDGNLAGYLAQILAGLNWLLTADFSGSTEEPGVDVVNASLGASGYNDYLYSALANARNTTGTVMVAAIGNAGRSGINHHGSPGNYDITVGVGASDKVDGIADFSDWGTVQAHGQLAKPDLCAPGVNVVSAKPGGGFQPMSGTSMASPVVAGAAALLLQQDPALELDAPRLVDTLLGLTKPLPFSLRPRSGAGRLDLTGI